MRPSPRAVLIVAGILVVAGGTAGFLLRPTPEDLEGTFASGGVVGPVLYAIAYAALTVALVPGLPLTLAAGALYGAVGGAIVSIVGATVGATGAFAIARRSARGSVKAVSGQRLEALEGRLSGKGFLALLVLRLIPVVPFSALNYAAGATSISARDYVLATAFGIIPGAVAYAALGAGLDDPTSPLFIGAAVLALALGLAAKRYSDRLALPEPNEDAPVDSRPETGDGTDGSVRWQLAWAALFFLVVVGLLIAVTVGGLFH